MIENITTNVIPINEIDDQEWNNFLLTTSESTFFCTTDWWQIFNDSYVLQIRNKDNELISGIPFRILSVIPFIGRFFRFCWLDSSALVNKILSESEVYNLKKLTFVSLIKYLKRKAIVMIISSKTRSHDANLFKDLGFNIEKSATLIIDLKKDENEIFKSFSKSNRNKIRGAIKKGVKIKIFEGESALPYISEFIFLQNKLFEHKNNSYSNLYFKSKSYLNTIFTSKYTKSYLALAYYNYKPAAATILISYKKLVYTYLSATDYLIIKESHASNLLRYEIIKYFKEMGFNYFDQGGIPFSSDPSINIHGVYMFKKSFGGDRYEYDHCNYALRKKRYWFIWKLRKYGNHPLIRLIYKILKK